MALNRGDIILAVHADLGKPRPAVVVQADEFNEDALTVLVCPLTTDIAEKSLVRPVLLPTAGTGLHERSQIMTDRLLALRRDRVRSVIGTVDGGTRDQLDRALLVVLGLIR